MDSEPLNVTSLIQTVRERAASEDPLVLLETAVAVCALVGDAADAMVDHFVGMARGVGESWTAIGDRLGVSKQAARQRFSRRLGEPTDPGEAAAVGVAPRLTACLQAAQEAADADDSVPSTQHLLLGLLQVGVASNVLANLGVTRERVRDANTRLFESVIRHSAGPGERRVVGDGEAEAALTRANRLAAEHCPSTVRTEHLLFVLATDPGSSARRVLDDLGVDVALIKKQLEGSLGRTQRRGRRRRRDTPARKCTFCGCTEPSRPMVAGPGVWICTDCVIAATDILNSQDRGLHAS